MSTVETRHLYSKTVKGMFWTYASYAISKCLVFLSSVILVRLLLPTQFGQVGYAFLIISYFNTIGSFGISEALIYEQKRSEDAPHVSFWINFVAGLFWTVLATSLAPLMASFFKEELLIPILRVMAWVFFVTHLGSTHEAILRRTLEFKKRFIPDFVKALTKGIISIALALMGWGVWSLVWGHLIGTVASTVALWCLVRWRPQLICPLALMRRMLKFGAQVVSVNIIGVIIHHADALVVGRILGSAALGFYNLASHVPELFISMLIWSAGKVMFPTYVKIKDDQKTLQKTFLLTVRYLSLMTLPMGVGLAFLARPLVILIYGKPWEPCIAVLQALAIALSCRSMGSPAGEIYKVRGRLDIPTKIGIVRAIILVPVLLWVSRFGIAGIAIAQMIIMIISTLVTVWIANKILELPFKTIIAEFKPSVFGVVVMYGVLVLLKLMMPWDFVSWLGLLSSFIVGAGVYGLFTWWMNPEIFQKVYYSFFGQRTNKLLVLEGENK